MKIRALQRCIPLAVTAALLVGGAVLLPTFVGVASAAAHSLSIADASVTEGTGAGSTAINLIVSSPALQPADCGFRIVLTHGSSSAADFTVTAFFDVTAVWDTNDADIPRTFQIAQDAIDEPNETFTVTITGDAGHPNPCPIGDGVATGTIIDDDLPLQPLSIADASVTEGTGAGSTAINLIVSSPALQPADCGFRIVLTHGSSSAADFTVTAFFDVTAVWDTNDADIPRTFQIAQDAIGELNETFTVTITGDAGSANPCPIGDGVATGTIIDDDGPPPTTAPPTTAPPTTAPPTTAPPTTASPTTALFAPPHATPTTAPPTTAPSAVQPPPARGNIPQTGSFNDDTLRMALALFAAGVALIVFVRRRSCG